MAFQLGMAQIMVEGGQPQANLARGVERIKEAATSGCHLVVLPECMDLGWMDGSAQQIAMPIPGAYSDQLARAAQNSSVYVIAGLVEREGDQIYNAAVMINPDGQICLHHRKINVLEIAQDLYSIGDRLAVTSTPMGMIGTNICADNFSDSLAIGHVLARMGAQILVSPSAWVVGADHDNTEDPYGDLWRTSYRQMSTLYDLTVVGVSCVGPLTDGPWRGRKAIGCSLAVGPGGEILAQGPYGEDAESLIVVKVDPQPVVAKGTQFPAALGARGYEGI